MLALDLDQCDWPSRVSQPTPDADAAGERALLHVLHLPARPACKPPASGGRNAISPARGTTFGARQVMTVALPRSGVAAAPSCTIDSPHGHMMARMKESHAPAGPCVDRRNDPRTDAREVCRASTPPRRKEAFCIGGPRSDPGRLRGFFVVPLVWLVLAPTKTDAELLNSNPLAFGGFRNVWGAWQQVDGFGNHIFRRWMANSLLYSLSATAITVTTSIPAGYGLVVGRFPGRRLILSLTLVALIMPPAALVLPIFLELNRFG